MSLLQNVIVPQLARPHGLLAPVMAKLLDRGNRDIHLHVLAALDLAPGERVLEVGFGGGVGLMLALQHEPRASLTGLELSTEMVRRGRKRFGDHVTLLEGSVDSIAASDGAFDKVYGANVTYFWPDIQRALGELKRVLRPGGGLTLGIRPAETLRRFGFDTAGHRVWTPGQYLEALAAAGFVEPQMRRVPDPNGAYLLNAKRT